MPGMEELASLLAIANSPTATAQATQFLHEQKLQAQAQAAQERMLRAQQDMETLRHRESIDQRRKEMEMQGEQFESEQGRLRGVQDADMAFKMKGFEEGKRQFNASEGRARAEHADEMALAKAKLIGERVEAALRTYGTASKSGAAGAFDADAYLKVGGTGMMGLALGPMPQKGETQEQADKRYAGEVARARIGYQSLKSITADGVADPAMASEAGKGFDAMSSILRTAMIGVPKKWQAEALSEVTRAMSDPGRILDNGGTLSPELEARFLAESSARLVGAAVEGTGLSPLEQARFATYWHQQDDPIKKANLLDKTLDNAVAQMKIRYGWTDEETLEFRANVSAGLSSAIQNGENYALTDVLRPGSDQAKAQQPQKLLGASQAPVAHETLGQGLGGPRRISVEEAQRQRLQKRIAGYEKQLAAPPGLGMSKSEIRKTIEKLKAELAGLGPSDEPAPVASAPASSPAAAPRVGRLGGGLKMRGPGFSPLSGAVDPSMPPEYYHAAGKRRPGS